MKKCLEIIVILLLFPMVVSANIGGATPKPGIFGEPTIFTKTDISIEKEELFINLFKEDNQLKCSFEAIYHLKRNQEESIKLTGIFYGLRAQNIEISNSSNLDLTVVTDSIQTAELDNLFFSTPINNSSNPASWFDLKTLSKTSFKYLYQPNAENIIKVAGILNLERTQFWGIAQISSVVESKHLWLNRDIERLSYQFQYLIEPISSWQSVGEIIVKVSYEKELLVHPFLFDKDNQVEKLKTNNKTNDLTHKKEFVIHLTDNLPSVIKLNVEEAEFSFCVGGPYIGLGNSSSEGFVTNFSWEFASNINNRIGIFYRLGYETNFKRYHTLSPNLIINSFLSGIIVGTPYDFNTKELFYRAGLSLDFLSIGIEHNWDYHEKSKNWETTFLFTITI